MTLKNFLNSPNPISIFLVMASTLVAAEDTPDFNREIFPILSENCLACHGPDENVREAGLRLDQKDGAFSELDSGSKAIVAGKSSESELYMRMISDDEDLLMPPPDSGKKVSEEDKEKIKAWIESGAKWSKHWAFVPPQKSQIPKPVGGWNSNNMIDAFIHQQLRANKLSPEKIADRETLIRRVTLDLIGLPPTIEQVDQFLADKQPGAFERVVDRLLQSEKYGEQMARSWLDAARYADTHGLHLDNERGIWPYRNWVIDSFNQNKRFDEFTVEQLAGDLLPKPTTQQRVATGFNRCNVTTGEGGSIDEEYYVRYAVDRVETTSTVWLGLTAGCASCHDHKFDPLSQKEFYSMFSYFYSLTERAMDGNVLLPPPSIKVPTSQQAKQLVDYKKSIADLKTSVETLLAEQEAKYNDLTPDTKLGALVKVESVWFDDALPEGANPEGNDGANSWQFVSAPDHPVFSGKHSTRRSAAGLTQHFFSTVKTKLKLGEGDLLFAYVYLDPKNPPETVQLQFNNGNWEHRAFWGADKGHAPGRKNASNLKMGELPETGKWIRLEVPAAKVGLPAGSEINGWAFTQFGGTVYWDKPGRVSNQGLSPEQAESIAVWEQYRKQIKQPSLAPPIQKILDIEASKRTPDQTKELRRFFVRNVNPKSKTTFSELTQKEADIKAKMAALDKSIAATLVMEDRKQKRQAYVLERGQYTEKRDPVSSSIPEWISPPIEKMESNRLGLAKWLVQKDHPLTSRVTVNRYWQHFFGTGIVKTSEDFGIQGERPVHPELLDWLSVDFIENGWNVKRLHKMIVMSATYQQSSRVAPRKKSIDPENRLLARGPRFRLDAEVIRDQALWVSGLLVETIGGKSVKPYQPAGLWKPVGFGGSNTSVFKQDAGDKLYRRSMYTFWKRTSPPPSMSTFDAPDRETCQVRRARTNTPLQALVLMNDVQYIEAARKLAERTMLVGGSDETSKITYAFRTILARSPTANELETLNGLHAEYLADFKKEMNSAEKLLSAGDSKRNVKLDLNEVAAWTMIAHLILNLSETVTKG